MHLRIAFLNLPTALGSTTMVHENSLKFKYTLMRIVTRHMIILVVIFMLLPQTIITCFLPSFLKPG